MRLRSWLLLAALVVSGGSAAGQDQEHPAQPPAAQPAVQPAPATTEPQQQPVEHAPAPAAAAHAEAASHDEHAEPTASEIFDGLFMHLQPAPITAVWWGGSKGFGFVAPYKADAQGEPLERDKHKHPVAFVSRAEFLAHYREAFGGGNGTLIYNINTAQWIAAVVVLVLFLFLARAARRHGSGAPTGVGYHMLESVVLYVRDEMVYKVMGAEQGRRFVPLFLTQFMFILAMNLLGLVWLPWGIGGTATANLAVTAGLALTTLLWINVAGIREHGMVGYWKNYVPHGLPVFVIPLIVVIEVASALLIKPAALMIRLFANLTAGHLVVMSLFALMYLSGYFLIGIPALLAFAMAVCIFAFEVFVAFVQAYIFTYLSIIFVGASVHPEH